MVLRRINENKPKSQAVGAPLDMQILPEMGRSGLNALLQFQGGSFGSLQAAEAYSRTGECNIFSARSVKRDTVLPRPDIHDWDKGETPSSQAHQCSRMQRERRFRSMFYYGGFVVRDTAWSVRAMVCMRDVGTLSLSFPGGRAQIATFGA